MDNTLDKYGYGFQTKLLSCLITDREFTTQCVDLIDLNYFENKALKFLIENTIFYFKERRVLPTLDVFKVQISNLDKGLFRTEVVSALQSAWNNIQSSDLSFVKEQTLEFCRHQEIRKAFENGLDLFKEGQYEEIVKLITDAAKKGQYSQDFGLEYLKDIEYRYSEEGKLERVATGFPVLDTVMDGGLPVGKLGIVMAPTGIGKSWLLAYFGANALKAGKKVLHYTLELDDVYTAQRYDTILTGIPYANLPYNIPVIKSSLSQYTGQLFIKEFPPSTLSLHQLETHIDKYILDGFDPDLVILDYAELLYINFDKNSREDKVLGQLYTDLRGLAGRKNFALWTADQTNRTGSTKEIVEGSDISNAFAKLFAVDFLMTLQRRPKDKVSNTARIHISKSRLGPDGMTFPCIFNTDKGIIDILDELSESGRKVKKSMITESEYDRKLLQQRYDELMSSTNKTDIF